ncbi:MAG: ABC transporter substrate-binding protein [Oscillospiraceae bacterium]|jgi:raffinose/stachyose/melibiose transport system substrate-binding protein|nr:ABC transporter substrate-binding protein [Oscillospiraceae bacterium]
MKKRLLALTLTALLLFTLVAACSPSSDNADNTAASGEDVSGGRVYFLNFKPEQDAAYQEIAKQYEAATGVKIKVETAASGTYEQTLRSELAKSESPTIFQVNGPVGYSAWKDYTADLTGSEIYKHLGDKSMAIAGSDGNIYAVPFAIEGYGIIANTKILDKYFALGGSKASSTADIKSFAKLKEVVEDMQARKSELGIDGVFASTSLKPGEDWRWQTHLVNVPMYYEWSDAGIDIADKAATAEIKFQFADNFKDIFDLYLNNSTIAPSLTGSKTVDDSMSEFALGKAAMVQNGNWAYGQISGVDGNTVEPGDVTYLPIYIGAGGEAKQGLCIGSENYICINGKASAADQQASQDFLAWLYTDPAGVALVTEQLGFIAPFDTFAGDAKPSDPLGAQVVDWNVDGSNTNVPWVFTIFPSQQFKDNFGGNLLLYAQGQMEWSAIKDAVIADWKTESANAE